MRKDTKPGYRRNTPTKENSSRGVRQHNCIICRHPEREAVEREYLEGWRLSDIRRKHPWVRSDSTFHDHLRILGLKDELKKRREIDAEEILERIIRAGLPVLDEGKVYPRDVIEAVKALNELKGKAKTGEIWRMIEFRRERDVSESIGATSQPKRERGIRS